MGGKAPLKREAKDKFLLLSIPGPPMLSRNGVILTRWSLSSAYARSVPFNRARNGGREGEKKPESVSIHRILEKLNEVGFNEF
jgi:hypothetical protein